MHGGAFRVQVGLGEGTGLDPTKKLAELPPHAVCNSISFIERLHCDSPQGDLDTDRLAPILNRQAGG